MANIPMAAPKNEGQPYGSVAKGDSENVRQKCERLVREHFEQHPFSIYELEVFEPPEGALLAEFFPSDKTFHCDPKREGKYPSLLLYNLEKESHAEDILLHIDRNKGRMQGLYGTSGAGKTRSVLEYLSRKLGLYFVASTKNDAGSNDLGQVIRQFEVNNVRRKTNGYSQDHQHYQDLSEMNYETMQIYLWMMVFVRNLVYAAVKKQAGDSLTAYQWLLIQLYPMKALHDDIFATVTTAAITAYDESNCEDISAYKALSNSPEKWNVVVVDESQVLLEQSEQYFLSSQKVPELSNTMELKIQKRQRSAFSAVLRGLETLALTYFNDHGHPVFAGTGMSTDDFEETASSVIAKGIGSRSEKSIFKNFRPLDEKLVRKYLYAMLNLEEKDIDEAVIQHVCKWLRGRPRWTASFLEAYLARKEKPESRRTRGTFSTTSAKLMEALDRYLANYTTNPDSDRRGSYNPEKGSPFVAIRNARLKYAEYDLGATLQRAVFQFAVGGNAAIFEENEKHLVREGLAAIRVSEDGSLTVLDEPIMVEAGINYFSLDQSALKNLKDQELGGHGEAFEKLILPAIQRNFTTVLNQTHPNDEVLPLYHVSTVSAYGVLAESCKKSIEKTIVWLERATSNLQFEGQVPPFCYPDDHFGPDLVFLLWDEAYKKYLVCLSQAKFRENFNQSEALRSITPSLLYQENRGRKNGTLDRQSAKLKGEMIQRWEDVKPRVVGNDTGCLLLMVQYPSYQKETAKPGMLADDEFKVQEPDKKKAKKLKLKLARLSTLSSDNAKGFFNADELGFFNTLKREGQAGDDLSS